MTTPEQRRTNPWRWSSMAIVAVCVVLAPVAAGAQVEASCSDGGGGYLSVEDKLQGRSVRCLGPEGVAPDCPNCRRSGYGLTGTMGVFFDYLDFGALELVYEETEIEALEGARLSSGAIGQQLTGGFSFGLGGRLAGWLRLPEVSFGIGGGSFEGSRTPLEGQRYPLEAQVTSIFLLRVELALGFEIPLPHVRPYALGRVAGTLYVVDAEVSDARLGRLGSESTSDGRWEVGTEVGLSIALGSRALALNIGWRANWLGTPGHGVSLSLVGGQGVGDD